MSFHSIVENYRDFDFPRFFAGVTGAMVERSLARDTLSPTDFLVLLSPKAGEYLEAMGRAFDLAVRAGRTAYLAGQAEPSLAASASSPLTGFLHEH